MSPSELRTPRSWRGVSLWTFGNVRQRCCGVHSYERKVWKSFAKVAAGGRFERVCLCKAGGLSVLPHMHQAVSVRCHSRTTSQSFLDSKISSPPHYCHLLPPPHMCSSRQHLSPSEWQETTETGWNTSRPKPLRWPKTFPLLKEMLIKCFHYGFILDWSSEI